MDHGHEPSHDFGDTTDTIDLTERNGWLPWDDGVVGGSGGGLGPDPPTEIDPWAFPSMKQERGDLDPLAFPGSSAQGARGTARFGGDDFEVCDDGTHMDEVVGDASESGAGAGEAGPARGAVERREADRVHQGGARALGRPDEAVAEEDGGAARRREADAAAGAGPAARAVSVLNPRQCDSPSGAPKSRRTTETPKSAHYFA